MFFISGPDAGSHAPRGIDPKRFAKGWVGDVASLIPPARKWGCKRFLVWCPFGLEADGAIHFDAYSHARVETPFLTRDFVEAWKPVTREGCEVIFYGGSLHYLKGLKPAAVLDAMDRALHPFLAAGGSVGFDASSDVVPGTTEAIALDHLTSRGVRWYVEAWPARSCVNLRSANWCCDNNFFATVKDQQDSHQAQGNWAAPLPELTGECIRLATFAPPHLKHESGTPWTWLSKVVPQVVQEGYSVAFALNVLIARGITRARLALQAGANLRR